jgi:hypothetical protein
MLPVFVPPTMYHKTPSIIFLPPSRSVVRFACKGCVVFNCLVLVASIRALVDHHGSRSLLPDANLVATCRQSPQSPRPLFEHSAESNRSNSGGRKLAVVASSTSVSQTENPRDCLGRLKFASSSNTWPEVHWCRWPLCSFQGHAFHIFHFKVCHRSFLLTQCSQAGQPQTHGRPHTAFFSVHVCVAASTMAGQGPNCIAQLTLSGGGHSLKATTFGCSSREASS